MSGGIPKNLPLSRALIMAEVTFSARPNTPSEAVVSHRALPAEEEYHSLPDPTLYSLANDVVSLRHRAGFSLSPPVPSQSNPTSRGIQHIPHHTTPHHAQCIAIHTTRKCRSNRYRTPAEPRLHMCADDSTTAENSYFHSMGTAVSFTATSASSPTDPQATGMTSYYHGFNRCAAVADLVQTNITSMSKHASVAPLTMQAGARMISGPRIFSIRIQWRKKLLIHYTSSSSSCLP